MDLFSWKYWLNISSVIFTMYIVIFYTMTPSKNECQMTFMMEPPRFIPVDIDREVWRVSTQRQYDINPRHDKYKLYMYSELGFPSSSDRHHDLKDSMPVLFVPGNAGSYQQVRSIASTCIRHQLQLLDAFKFIFYTIDFNGQLSGFDGKLIQDQTQFVHRSIRQILKLHPAEVEGVILIGHSVGGFISKLLFTEPDFDQKSVPLLISLASPLTKPYLTFDDRMHQLYLRANSFWASDKLTNQTVSISVSGGRSDRLVPLQLSMDPLFDISLTTSSIRDVWLATDHVCITWCRELTHKFSRLLSKLMDKKKIQINGDRKHALLTATEELLLDKSPEEETHHHSIWKIRRSIHIVDLNEFYTSTRYELMTGIIIVNVTNTDNILVHIDHVEDVKSSGIFGCGSIELESASIQTTCKLKLDMMNLARRLPTKKFDTRKTLIRLNQNQKKIINYVVLDFNQEHGYEKLKTTIPEQVTIQPMENLTTKELHIPSMFTLLISKIWPLSMLEQPITANLEVPTYLTTFRIKKNCKDTLYLRIDFISSKCSDGHFPSGPHVLLYKNGYLGESFLPTTIDDSSSITSVVLDSYDPFSLRTDDKSFNSYLLDLYIDGRCNSRFSIHLDLIQTIYLIIKSKLEEIFVCLVFLSCVSIKTSATHLKKPPIQLERKLVESSIARLCAYISVNIALDKSPTQSSFNLDELLHLLLVYVIANGLYSTLKCLSRRVTDVAKILNDLQGKVRKQINSIRLIVHSNGVIHSSNELRHKPLLWIFTTATIAASVALSTGLLTLLNLITLINCSLTIRLSQLKHLDKHTGNENNKHISTTSKPRSLLKSQQVEDLITDLSVLVTVTLLTNLPKTIIQLKGIRDLEIPLFDSSSELLTFISASTSVILLKLITDLVTSVMLDEEKKQTIINGPQTSNRPLESLSLVSVFMELSFHVIALLIIFHLKTNICQMNYILTAALIFVRACLK